MDNLEILRAREEEVGREWEWLHDAINRVARVRAEQGEVHMFRILQQQARVVGQRRVELRLKMAALEDRRTLEGQYSVIEDGSQ